jgi:hypothetical protein
MGKPKMNWIYALAVGAVLAVAGNVLSSGMTLLLVFLSALSFGILAARTRQAGAVWHGMALGFLANVVVGLTAVFTTYNAPPDKGPDVLPPLPLFAAGALVLAVGWAAFAGLVAWTARKVISSRR